MSEPWVSLLASWLLRTAVGGGLLLLIGWGLLGGVRQPAWRQRLGESALAAALVLAVLSLMPSWLLLPCPQPAPSPAEPAAVPARAEPTARKPAPEPDEKKGLARDDRTAEARAGALFAPDLAAPEDEPGFAPEADELPAPATVVPSPAAAAPIALALPPARAEAAPAIGTVLATRVVVGLYLTGALWFIGRWLLGYLALRRLLGTARPAPRPVARLFEKMAASGRLRPRLLVSPRLRVPLSCGVWRPTVLLPASLCEEPAGPALRWVFAHELTHLERRDAWTCLLFALAQPIYFYLPWLWWLRRQVGLCQEFVADAAVIADAAVVEDYAQFLLSLTGAPAVPGGATGVLGNSSDLFRRVTMLLQSPVPVQRCCPRLWSWGVAGGLLTLAVVVSGLGLRADAANPDRDKESSKKLDKDPVKVDDPAKKEEPARKADKEKRLDPQDFQKQMEEMQKRLQELSRSGASGEEMQREMQKMMEDMRKHFPQMGFPQGGGARFGGLGGGFGAGFGNGFPGGGFGFGGPHNGRLGVMVQPPSQTLADQLDLPKGQGQVIERIQPDSPAAKAGLKPNDILLELDGKAVKSQPREFIKLVQDLKADKAVDAVVLRKGKRETVKGLKLPEVPERNGFPGGAGRFGGAGAGVPGGVPGFPGGPGAQAGPIGDGNIGFGFAGGGPGGQVMITTTFRTGDRFTTRYQEGSLVITLTGSTADGKAKVGEINVHEGRESHKYESVDKVPEQYRDKVKNLLDMTQKGVIKVETRQP